MPEINPVTKDQLFEKKIAENTGSNYNVGDISDVVPVTKDQALLKEIALNSAGQSGDITELEGKVTANAEAIEAMVNVNGCCNVLDLSNPSIVSDGVTFTVNTDGSVTANGTAVTNSFIVFKNAVTTRDMVVVGASDGVHIIVQPYGHSWEEVDEGIIHGINQNGFALQVDASVTVNNVTVYPMLYDARLTPTGYVPYAMTNRELTDAVNRGSVSVTADGVKTWAQLLGELYASADLSKITYHSKLVEFNAFGYIVSSITAIEKNKIYINFMCPSSSNANGEILSTYQISSPGYRGQAYSGAEHDISSQVVISGNYLTLYY